MNAISPDLHETVNETTKLATTETLLNPRFYTTDSPPRRC